MASRWVRAGWLFAFLVGSSAAGAQERIAIGTGGTAGLFYVVGSKMAEVINKHLAGANARAEVTGASLENIRRVAAGQQTIGFASSSALYEARKGEKSFQSAQPVAAVARLYPAVLQIAVVSDKFTSIDDLKDAVINLGPPGSNSAVFAQRLLAAYGVYAKERSRFLSYAESLRAMLSGTINAAVVLAGAPTEVLVELAAQRPMRLLSVDPARLEALLKEHVYYQVDRVPAGTYKGQTEDAVVIDDAAILFANEKADQQLVYDITRTIFGHLDEIAAVHRQAMHIRLDTAPHTPIELHPGAKRYFDEVLKISKPAPDPEPLTDPAPAAEPPAKE
jgi:TRAP transporter TAXI family solute receptor